MKHIRLYQNTDFKIDNEYILDSSATYHLVKVLRFPQGKTIILFNGNGIDYTAKVLLNKKKCVVQVFDTTQNLSESKLNLTLIQGIVKGEKMDFIIQKSVELGIRKIIPIFTEHCVVKLRSDKLKKRSQHWQKIIIGACEQSGRAFVPEIVAPLNLEELLKRPVRNGFVLHHRAEQGLLTYKMQTESSILIGPEGGLTKAEIVQATAAGYQPLLLASRVLRVETAVITAIANMQLLWGS